jgi:hypothetical protein
MTRTQAIQHNEKVIREVINALVDFKLADPYELITNHQYALEMVQIYLEAANIARNMMHMPPLVLYTIKNVDEE